MSFFKTAEEILKEIGVGVQNTWGNTPLNDPEANKGDNLVRFNKDAAIGQSRLTQAMEYFTEVGNINNLSGDLLTSEAARRGVFRKTGTFSKTQIFVTGESGAKLASGSVLTDSLGLQWITTNEITLVNKGFGCAIGEGVACATESGTFRLQPYELFYDNSTTPWINTATNAVMLEIGGAQESDDMLRMRVSGQMPLWNVQGTVDYVVRELLALDGVNFVRQGFYDTCIGNGQMFIVNGGIDSEICEVIKLNAGLGCCGLLGETSCNIICSDVKFQRPCPVVLCINVVLSCDCPVRSIEDIKQQIISIAPDIAKQTVIRSNDFVNINSGILDVKIGIQNKPLVFCPSYENTITVIDPFTGEEILWGTSSTSGLCSGSTCVLDCSDKDSLKNYVKLTDWQYAIVDENFISVEYDCSEPTAPCNNCGETTNGCSCSE